MAAAKKKITPMMEQYLEAKKSLPANCLLLFRLGDFYEMFDQDAETGSKILGITLTRRNGQPMAGIPYHAADNYIHKVLAAGKKVAICDQMEAPQAGKIVKRAITRILTPGTTMEDHQVEARQNHYLLALEFEKGRINAAWLDITTGDFRIACESNCANLLPALTSIDPREIIVPESTQEALSKAAMHGRYSHMQRHTPGQDSGNHGNEGAPDADTGATEDDGQDRNNTIPHELAPLLQSRPVNGIPDYHFDAEYGARRVMETLGVLNLDGFGLDARHAALGAAGAVIHYAAENLRETPGNLSRLREYHSAGNLLLDPATLRNLEIFRTDRNTREGSLLQAMDGTATAPGARLLENWLSSPVLDLAEIRRRQQAVGAFLEAPGTASELQEYLKGIRDIPRILGRLQNRLKTPRELGGILETLCQLPHIQTVLDQFDADALADMRNRIEDFPELRELLEKALADELPNNLQDGGFIRDGYDSELDRLRLLARDNKTWIADLEREEQARTGIKNLRIKYNSAFGYFIEVTKSNLSLVPDDYIRKQTMTNAERYYTPALKEKEKEILHADEKSIAHELEIFRALAASVLAKADSLEATAAVLAEVDVCLGWAQIAREWDYCRPQVDGENVIEIEQGRHPVVEQMMRRERMGLSGTHAFVPNDTRLTSSETQIAIITGPNMAGKSTYIRQVALITLMAQVGSWVPASRCRIGLVDRIFSRVGASDELSRGNSTFMVEMNETANILNNCTSRSLIILDEIGRGTSTYDGLSIAWSVVEHLHGDGDEGPRTLFATHYHELTQITRQLPRIRNYRVAVKEWNDEIIFVRQVVEGAADRSYGIQVARLAGLPPSVIKRAKSILERLESEESSHNLLRLRMKKIHKAQEDGASDDLDQLELF